MDYLSLLCKLDKSPLPAPLAKAVGDTIIQQRMQGSPVPDEDKVLHLIIIAFGAGRNFQKGLE